MVQFWENGGVGERMLIAVLPVSLMSKVATSFQENLTSRHSKGFLREAYILYYEAVCLNRGFYKKVIEHSQRKEGIKVEGLP